MKMKSKVRIEIRIRRCHVLLDVEADRLRRRLLVELNEAFHIASNYARGSMDRVTDQNGKKRPLTITERRSWVQATTFIAQIMANINKGIDESQINEDLNRLEALLNKIAAVKTTQESV